MKSILPGRFDLGLFIAMALLAGALVAISPQRDTALFLAALPIFFVAAMLGFRRSLIVLPVKEVEQETILADAE